MVVCNNTLEKQFIDEEPLWEHGLTFHHLFLIVSAVFGLVSIVISLYLIFQHATHYSKPTEQKHIIRILFMIPIYSIVSFLSYLNYRHSIYYSVLGDCYEAFAIASFFTLLCNYIAPNLHDQKEYFRQIKPVNWFWGVFGFQYCTGGKHRGPLRIPRSGLTWFNVIYVSVFQYCLIRVLFTIVSVVTQAFDRYCDASLNPAFAHVWVEIFEAASVSIAMFCLIQFYIQLRKDLAHHRPFLKVLSIKLVIFFSFWQTFVISFLSSSDGPLHPSAKIAYSDIKIGIPSVLLCVEMAIFAVLHLFAFPWSEYTLSRQNAAFKAEPYSSGPGPEGEATYQGGHLGLKALGEAFNPWDIIKASARGFRWLFVGRRNRFADPSYQPHLQPDDASLSTAGGRPGTSGGGAQAELNPRGGDAEMKPLYNNGGRNHMTGDMATLLANAEHNAATSPGRRGSWADEGPGTPGSGYHPGGYGREAVGMPSAAAYGGRDGGSPEREMGGSYAGHEDWRR